ncbi:TPA: class I SAM-dependent methyltransferase [Vibrio parahaemolyticus]|nr:class I SAM-dependent methyltransferase [Vibrio parahaemolyticus]HCH3291488.1 class I SAM-dependent methyltransferase [Vibrio parahaemolyticus]HCH5011655.1 class I SAM-dependent methyltransferase [Vibrio parahaemolyticus]HCH5426500.1 class I SAM-dependent methyltransferase [Vibrio parahaemolyticus]HCH5431811.1 class I SAM-dependent methyltransferase [Vibrio parahaemolyticus]
MSVSWDPYYQKVAQQPHRVNVEKALQFHTLAKKIAVDAGCGTGRDSSFLLAQGFRVHAFENNSDAIKTCETRFSEQPNFSISQACFSDFDYPKCTLFIASASLFFCPKAHFENVWNQIDSSLPSGGVFCGDFLGVNDSWVDSNSHAHLTSLTRQQVEQCFEGYDIVSMHERDEDGTTIVGTPKHWHVFSVTAVKC